MTEHGPGAQPAPHTQALREAVIPAGQGTASNEAYLAAQPLAHDGRTLAAWTGSAIAGAGFVVSTIGFLLGLNWPVIWAGFGVVAIGAIVGLVMRNLGYGAREN